MNGFNDSEKQAQGSDPLEETRQNELSILYQESEKVRAEYLMNLNKEVSCELVPLLSILADKSNFDERDETFWSAVKIFDQIGPVWNVKVMKSAFDYYKFDSNSIEHIISILDFVKGRFMILKQEDYWIEVKTSLCYFGLIVFEVLPVFEITILVCAGPDEMKRFVMQNALSEIRQLGKSIVPIQSIGYDSLDRLIVQVNDHYKPGIISDDSLEEIQKKCNPYNYPGLASSSPIIVDDMNDKEFERDYFESMTPENMEKDSKEKGFENESSRKLEDVVMEPNLILETQNPVLNTTDSFVQYEKNESKDAIENLSSRQKQMILGSYETESKSKSDMKEKNSLKSSKQGEMPILIEESEKKLEIEILNDDLKILKASIEKNKEFYLAQFNKNIQGYDDWIFILLNYHKNSEFDYRKYDLYSELKLLWKISVFDDFFENLLSFGQEIFCKYLVEILAFAKGNIIDDVEFFYKINSKSSKDYIIAPILIQEPGLNSILSVLYYENFTQNVIPSIKILGYWDEFSYLKLLSDFERGMKYMINVKDDFKRKSIADLVFIEKFRRILPIKNLALKYPDSESTLYFVINFNNLYEYSLNILVEESKEVINAEKILTIENTNTSLFSAKIKNSDPIRIQLETSSWHYWSKTSQDEYGIRKPFFNHDEFLFDVQFKLSYHNQFKSNQVEQLHACTIYLLKNHNNQEILNSFCKKYSQTYQKSQRYEINSDKSILSAIESSVVSDSNLSFQQTFTILVVLSFLNNFPFKDSKLSIITKLRDSLSIRNNNLMILFLERSSYIHACAGLAKVVMYNIINKDSYTEFLNFFTDYRILKKILQTIIQEFGVKKYYLNDEDIQIFLKYVAKFQTNSKVKLIKSLFSLLKNIQSIIKFLIEDESLIPESEKKRIFSEHLLKVETNDTDFLEFLTLINSEPYKKSFIIEGDHISKFIARYFESLRRIDEKELPVLRKILYEIISSNNFKSFNKNGLIQKMMKNISFASCFEFIQILGLDPLPYFLSWLDQKEYYYNFSNNDKIKKADKEINKLLTDDQKLLSEAFLETVKSHEFFGMMNSFSQVNCEIFKHIYIEKFKFHILTDPSVRNSINKTNKKTLGKSDEMFKEIFMCAVHGCSTSENELHENLIINPSESHALFKFIKNHKSNGKLESYQKISEYFRNYLNKISSQTITMREFKIFFQHSEEQKKTFLNFARFVLNNSNENEEFIRTYEAAYETYKIIIKKLNDLKILVYKYPFKELRFEELIDQFEDFHFHLWETQMQSIEFNEEMSEIIDLFTKEQVPLNSLIFLSFFEHFECDYFQMFILDTSNQTQKFFSLLENDLAGNTGKLMKHLTFVTKEKEVKKETKLLSIFFSSTEESENFTKSISNLLIFSQIDQLVKNINNSAKLLGIEEYLLKNLSQSEVHPEVYLKNLSSFLENYFRVIDLNQIKTLEIFFKSISESHNAIILVNNLQEDEISFWQECFQENKENERLSLELIQVFSNVWTFFNIIKGFLADFAAYFSKIFELLQTIRYKCILEELSRCEDDAKVLEEYHKSLNNQEQGKLNKIKMIVNRSGFRINSNDSKYDIGLFILKENNEYDKNRLELSDLRELRDRALLSKYIIDQKAESKEIVQDVEVYEKFVLIVDTMSEFISILDQLSQSLYKDSINIDVDFYIERGEYLYLLNFFEYYKNLRDSYEQNSFKPASKRNYWINFLSGDRIILMDKFIFNQTHENLKNISNLLTFMQKLAPKSPVLLLDPGIDMAERLNIIATQIESYQSVPDPIPLNLQGVERKVIPSGHFIIAETKEYYRAILSIYSIYENLIPSIDIVFFCYLSSTWDELKMFVSRCFLNPNNRIFTLIYPENLSLENQTKLESKIMKSFKISRERCLAIVTSNPRSKIVNNLRYQSSVPIEKLNSYNFLKNDKIIEILNVVGAGIQVVSSEKSGLGKTMFIKSNCMDAGSQLREIDLSGTYESFDLGLSMERVSCPDPTIYHIQVSFLSNPDYFEHLVFSLSIFKQHYSQKSLFTLADHSKIFIELANTFRDKLSTSLPYLKLMPNRMHIESFNLNNLEVSSDLIYVCNYLKSYNSGTINSVDLSYARDSLESLTREETVGLLKKYFLTGRQTESNFHQLQNFIKILSKLLRNFERSVFSAEFMKIQMEEFMGTDGQLLFQDIRSSMLESMVETTKEFTSKCTESVFKGQESALIRAENSKNDEEQNLADCSIKWENSNHFIVLFLEEGDFLSIYRDGRMVPENIRKLILSQNFVEQSVSKGRIPNFRQLMRNSLRGQIKEYSEIPSSKLIEEVVSFYIKHSLRKQRDSISRSSSSAKKNFFEVMKLERIKELEETGYILTPDNFLKMNLIYLRCISNLPLIIMGETGCGKTSLLRFFIQEVLQESLEIIYIHSGITVEFIRLKLEDANAQASRFPDQRVWVFFDEFNTSDFIGVIVNVLCERKFENMNFLDNLIFVGACNPYRVKSAVTYQENVGIKKKQLGQAQAYLVHLVKPLPDKAIEFVWDFGALKQQEIQEYVRSMLCRVEISNPDLFVDLICAVHNYFQEKEDLSSVSLRDVHRFIQLHEWFSRSIKRRSKFPIKNLNNPIYQELNEELQNFRPLMDVRAGLLALLHCYFLRISSTEQREEFFDTIIKIVLNYIHKANKDQVEKLIQFEQLDFISRMVIPEGIALNQALTENVFAILPCLMNQIPIFICGKPGCSKSLAIQIIQSSVRGEKSADDYLKTLPELNVVSFQGSDSCTSEGIEEVFKKAEKLKEYGKAILPVVLFDEIGLAEVSRYNPLKVLHRLLEAENCKVGFIAISNWRLDASKMNRALYLARPDPEQDDLEKTASTLFKSLKVNIEDKQVKSLAKGYFKLKKAHKATIFPDFYGLRDFYHMIKLIGNKLKSTEIQPGNKSQSFELIVQHSLIRNFNGLESTKQVIKESFKNFYNQHPGNLSVFNLIEENLSEKDSRYLMIICARDVSLYLQSTLIKEKLPKARFIIGSTLENDILEESTRFRILSDIIGYMEQGIPIVLQNMDIIYSSLYDLFNQNFIKLGNSRKYCRIALGTQFNPKCFVNDSFKVVVFLDSDDETLKSADAPFLNRFEKHFVSVKEILTQDCVSLSLKLEDWVQRALDVNKPSVLDPVAVFPCYSQESLNLLIKLFESRLDAEKKCKKFLLKTAAMDLLFLGKMNRLLKEENEEVARCWKKIHSMSFTDYLAELISFNHRSKRVKMISVTYDPLSIDELKQRWHSCLQIEKCSNFKSEEDLRRNFYSFINGQKSLYLFEVDYQKESQHLRFVVNVFERVYSEFDEREGKGIKNLIVLVRMARNNEKRQPLCIIQGWKFRMFEDLYVSPLQIAEEILELDTKTIVNNEKFFKFEENVAEISQKALESLIYQSNVVSFDQIVAYKASVQEALTENQEIVKAFKWKILSSIGKFLLSSREKWYVSLFTSEKIISQALSVKDALKIYVFEKFFTEFTKLIVLCEKKAALSQVIYLKGNECFSFFWISYFNNLITSSLKVQLTPESNQLKFMGQLYLPFIYEDVLKLVSYSEEITESAAEPAEFARMVKTYHREKCTWKDASSNFYHEAAFLPYFIKDFISIVLLDQHLDSSSTQTIFLISNYYLSQYPQEEKVPKLLLFRETIINLCKVFQVYHEIADSTGTNFAFDVTQPDFLENIPVFFENMINDIYPSYQILQKVASLKDYSRKLMIFQELVELILVEKIPENLEILEFWAQLARLENFDLIIEVAGKVSKEGFNTLFDEATVDELLEKLGPDTIQVSRFKVFYFKNLLERNPGYLEIVIRDINENELWKFSGILIDLLLEMSELREKVNQLEENTSQSVGFLSEKNDYLQNLSDIIQKADPDCKFCILLCDKISQIKIVDELKHFNDVCRSYMFMIEGEDLFNDHSLKVIIACGRLKSYLFEFSQVLTKEDAGYHCEEEDMVEDIKNLLNEAQTMQYELFIIKTLKSLCGDTLFKLMEKIKKIKLKWKHDPNQISIQSNLHIFPFIDLDNDYYNRLTLKLSEISQDFSAIDQELNAAANPELKLLFGLAFMNQVYLQYKSEGFNAKMFIDWYSSRKEETLKVLGPIYSRLLSRLISNFPEDSLLFINSRTDDVSFYKAQTIVTILLITISHQQVPNPLSSLLFEGHSKPTTSLFARTESLFVVGSEVVKIQDLLKHHRDNFEINKSTTFSRSYSKGGSYVCSDTCDFFYIVNNCGGTVEMGRCPFCNQQIGGTGHQSVQRHGHRNLSDDEARKFLHERCEHYKRNQPRGLNITGNNSCMTAPREMKLRLSYNFLNLCIHSLMYFCKVCRVYPETQLAQIYKVQESHLIEQRIREFIDDDFKEISGFLQGEDRFYWILACVTGLKKVIDLNQFEPTTDEIRTAFEIDFERLITAVDSNLMINSYKMALNTQLQPSNLIEFLEELEVPPDNLYPYSFYYRETVFPTWEKLSHAFNHCQRKLELKTLYLFNENFNEIRNLSNFWPIIKFLKSVISEFSFKVSRSEARSLPIKEALKSSSNLIQELDEFLRAWNSLSIVLRYECKTFQRFDLSCENPLIDFLVDNDINSPGIHLTAALRSLGDLQNRLKLALFDSGQRTERSGTIFQLTEKEIFCLDDEFLQSLAFSCSVSRCELGRGKEVFYDFDRVQVNIERKLAQARLLNTEKIETVQFKYELLNTRSKYSGLIRNIREMSDQQVFNDKDFNDIEKIVKIKASSQHVSTVQVFNDIYSYLSRILTIFHKQDLREIKKVTDFELFGLKIASKYKIEDVINDLEICKITSLFEKLEILIYPEVLKIIGDDYKNPLVNENLVKESVAGFKIYISQKFGEQAFVEAHNVLKRICCRLLTSNFDPEFSISDYFGIECYWSLEYLGQYEDIAEVFPKELKFKNAVKVENIFNEMIKVKEEKKAVVQSNYNSLKSSSLMKKSIKF